MENDLAPLSRVLFSTRSGGITKPGIREPNRQLETSFLEENLPPVPDSLEELVQMTMGMVNFTVHDEKVVMMRKVLTIEQFRDERAKELATRYFLTGLTQIFTHVFQGMMDKGLLRQDNPEMLAFAYTAPISALIRDCDREPEKEPEILRQIEAFVKHFIGTYERKGK